VLILDVFVVNAGMNDGGLDLREPEEISWPKDAIVAMNPSGCEGNPNGAVFGGSGDITISRGGIYTKGCLRGNGSDYDVFVADGFVRYEGETSGSMNFYPPEFKTFLPVPVPVDFVDLIKAQCAGLPFHWKAISMQSGGQEFLYPGNYKSLTFDSGDWIMMPGLYCLTEDLRINPDAHLEGQAVTIFIQRGDVLASGTAEIYLSAPQQAAIPLNLFTHLLLYLAEGDFTWNGGPDQQIDGRVYAPKGNMQVNGGSEMDYHFLNQFIGWNVEVSGNGSIEIFPYFLGE
jgi:hypothetical protein